MIQPHNRHMSFSVYISALAVADTAALLNGKLDIYGTSFCVSPLTLRVLCIKNEKFRYHEVEDEKRFFSVSR